MLNVNDESPVKTTATFQLKGRLFTLTVIQLLDTDLDVFSAQLVAQTEKMPKFFHDAPVVVDLQKVDSSRSIDFNALVDILRTNNLIPVGIRGGSEAQQLAAKEARLPTLSNKTQNNSVDLSDKKPTANVPEKINVFKPAKIIEKPVRSGQQIYAENADLIVLASVSHGAELLADGNIHVYGSLRGRALAGVSGYTNARIFCQSLEAELISIAGYYLINEENNLLMNKNNAHIYLRNETLHVEQFEK